MSGREKVMFKGSAMSEPPPERPDEPGDDQLARMFAAEEAAISDDGFSKRVVEKARDEISWRRRIVYGAGMAGFGVALASIIDMAPHLPKLSGWVNGLSSGLRQAEQGALDPLLLIVAAVVAGVSFMLVAILSQER
jgi:hypothetical protein